MKQEPKTVDDVIADLESQELHPCANYRANWLSNTGLHLDLRHLNTTSTLRLKN